MGPPRLLIISEVPRGLRPLAATPLAPSTGASSRHALLTSPPSPGPIQAHLGLTSSGPPDAYLPPSSGSPPRPSPRAPRYLTPSGYHVTVSTVPCGFYPCYVLHLMISPVITYASNIHIVTYVPIVCDIPRLPSIYPEWIRFDTRTL